MRENNRKKKKKKDNRKRQGKLGPLCNPQIVQHILVLHRSLLLQTALQEKKPEPPAAESRAVKILADSVKEQEKTDELQDEWVLAASVLNRFFMWLFLASVVITLIAVFSVDTRFEN